MFPRWKMLLFSLAGTLGILALVALPAVHDDTDFDPATGRKEWVPPPPPPPPPAPPRVPTPLERGDAAAERDRLRSLGTDADPQVLAILDAELTPPPRSEAGAGLERAIAGEATPAQLLEILQGLEADAEIASATEAYFAVPFDALPPGWSLGPDGWARLVSERVDAGEDVPLLAYVLVARAFQEADRMRGRMRWLLRGYERFPRSAALRDAMIEAFVESGRLNEALAVSTQGVVDQADHKSFWKRRVQLAAWSSRPEIEVEALERLLTFGADNEARQRALQLYTFLGQQDRALEHALRIVEEAGELAAYERAAYVALRNAKPDAAFELLAELVRRSNDPARWQEKLVEYSLQDLQFDRAIAELERLVAEAPDVRYFDQLEGLYRRRDMPAQLAGLLEQRLQWEPANAAALRETVSIWTGLGQRERARQAIALQRLAAANPRPVPRRLTGSEVEAAQRVEAQARSLIGGTEQPRLLGDVLEDLRPFLGEARFRRVVQDLLRRYPDEPAARNMRLELLDYDRTPAEAAKAAQELAQTYPDDVATVRAWADRAAWAGLADDEVRARQRLLELLPDDHDNRRGLADLLEAQRNFAQAAEQWGWLADVEGLRSPSVARLVGVLFAAGRADEALDWLTRRAADPRALLSDRLAAAQALFDHGRFDQAIMMYRSVLVDEPDHPQSLLRLGQIHSWTNDARRAVPHLERLRELGPANAVEVDHLLGEAYWAVGDSERGLQLLARVLEDLRAQPEPSLEHRAAMARILSRLGRADEAMPIFRAIVAQAPDNVDLLLDFVDLCIETGALDEARVAVDHVRELGGSVRRAMRIDAELCAAEGDTRRAAGLLREQLETFGPDAGTLAELGRVSEVADDWYDALQAFRRWKELQDDSLNAAQSVHRLETLLVPLAAARVEWSETGADSVVLAEVDGSVPLDADRTRLHARVGVARYEGRAQAVMAGLQDIAEDLTLVDVAIERRWRGRQRFGGGVSLAAGAPGGTPAGAFGNVLLTGDEPYWSLELHAYANRVFTEPAAAVGLEGRSHGLEASYYRDAGEGWWFSGVARTRLLEIRPPTGGKADDLQVAGELSVGRTLIEGDSAVAGRFRAQRLPTGPSAPFLAPDPAQTRDLTVNVWASVQAFRLLGSAELPTLLPLDEHSEYLTAAARIDKHLRSGLGAKLEGYAGASLGGGGAVWGLDGGFTWTPRPGVEWSAGAGLGESLNRSGFDASSRRAHFQLVLRW